MVKEINRKIPLPLSKGEIPADGICRITENCFDFTDTAPHINPSWHPMKMPDPRGFGSNVGARHAVPKGSFGRPAVARDSSSSIFTRQVFSMNCGEHFIGQAHADMVLLAHYGLRTGKDQVPLHHVIARPGEHTCLR